MKRLTLAAVALLCCAAPGRADDYERWYALLLGDQRAGWAHATQRQRGELTDTDLEIHFQLRRGAFVIPLNVAQRYTETADGRSVEAVSTTRIGQMEVKQTLKFTDEGIEAVSEQGGQSRRRLWPTPPAERTPLPPAAARRLMLQHLARGAQTIEYWLIEPSSGPEPIHVQMELAGRRDIEAMGKVVPAFAWRQRMSLLPGMVTTVYVDDQGRDIKTELPLPGVLPGAGAVVMLATDEQLAKAALNPPEMLLSSLIEPDRPLSSPRSLERAVFELRSAGEVELSIPTVGAQRATRGPDGSWSVTVDLSQPTDPGEDVATDEHLRASAMLNHADPAVRELVEKALRGGGGLSRRDQAQALRRFVGRFIVAKDLSVGLASASEVARTAQGDCTEHAVLLAALLRGAGIPSRTVSGLVYVSHFQGRRDVLAYHMWTQAWLGDDAGVFRWVDLDATLSEENDRGFDAAHIALSISAMADGWVVNDMVALLPMFGATTVRVIEPAAPR